MQIFIENPMLMVSVIVFIVCVIIGFFGDRYLRSQNKIGKILGGDKKEPRTNSNEVSSNEELKETNPELITSQNINNFNDGGNLESQMGYSNNIENQVQPLNKDANTQNVQNINYSGSYVSNPSNMNQEISEPIVPDAYPPENNPQGLNGSPTPFDGQINTDDHVNNIF